VACTVSSAGCALSAVERRHLGIGQLKRINYDVLRDSETDEMYYHVKQDLKKMYIDLRSGISCTKFTS